jgi:N4-gp56 family major capsid protein
MAALATSTTQLTLPVNFVLMKALLSAARQKLPFMNGTLPGTLQKNQGAQTVKWRRIENLSSATTPLGEFSAGTAVAFLGRDAVRPSITDVTAEMKKYGNLVLTTEELDLYNVNSRNVQLMETLGANAGLSLNLLAEAEFRNATNVRYCTATAGGGANDSAVTSAIQLNDIKWSVNKLNANSAMLFTSLAGGSQNIGTLPVRQSYYGICHVDVEEDVRGLSGFIPVEQYGGYTETMPFEFGAVAGVRWCSTEIIPVTSNITGATTSAGSQVLRGLGANGGYDVYSSYIYGQEAIGTVGLGNMFAASSAEMYDPKNPPGVVPIYHAPGSSGIFDPYNEMASLAWKAFFAAKILNAGWVIKVRSGASKL